MGYYFLDRLYDAHLTQQEADRFAMFILREAKESVGGVGKGTQAYFLPYVGPLYSHSRYDLATDWKIPRLDEVFTKFWLAVDVKE